MASERLQKQVEKAFSTGWYYSKEWDSGRHKLMADNFRAMAAHLLQIPESRELSLALTALEESFVWASRAIVQLDPPTEA